MLQLAQDTTSGWLQPGDVFPALVVAGGLLVGLIIAVVAIIAGIFNCRQREETKREIAAYVAEGTIDADTAVTLLRADDDLDKCIVAVKSVIGRDAKVAPA